MAVFVVWVVNGQEQGRGREIKPFTAFPGHCAGWSYESGERAATRSCKREPEAVAGCLTAFNGGLNGPGYGRLRDVKNGG